MVSSAETKAKQRHAIRSLLKTISPEQRQKAGQEIAVHIEKWLTYHSNIFVVGLFANLSDEISTKDLDDVLKKRNIARVAPFFTPPDFMVLVLLPKHQSLSDFKPSGTPPPLATLSPIDSHLCDIIFVPGLAFDKLGHRLGRGQGHYDRCLKQPSHKCKKPVLIGLAMDEQIMKEVVVAPHDVSMDYICTPSLGIYKT